MKKPYKLKSDRYSKVRGGESHLLELFCSHCETPIVLYQKDGIGALYRLYIDRILGFRSSDYPFLAQEDLTKSTLPSLHCANCGELLAVPMIYEVEGRLAYRLVRGKTQKKTVR